MAVSRRWPARSPCRRDEGVKCWTVERLESFYDQMERSAVELDSIRGSLLSVTASTDVVNQQRLAGDVRALRDDLGTLAEGMSATFEERAP